MRCYERWRALGFTFIRDPRAARLVDFLVLTPFLIASGLIYKILPLNVRVAFITAGIIIGLWNGIAILLEDYTKPKSSCGCQDEVGATFRREGNHIIVGERRPLKADANLNPGDYNK